MKKFTIIYRNESDGESSGDEAYFDTDAVKESIDNWANSEPMESAVDDNDSDFDGYGQPKTDLPSELFEDPSETDDKSYPDENGDDEKSEDNESQNEVDEHENETSNDESDTMFEFGGKKFDNDGLKDIFENYVELANIVEDFKNKDASFSEKEKELKALSESEEMILVNYLKDNPEIRDKFNELLQEEDPDIAIKHNTEVQGKQVLSLKDELEKLRTELSEMKEERQKGIQNFEAQRRNEYINSVINENEKNVGLHIDKKLSMVKDKFGIALDKGDLESVLVGIRAKASQDIGAGKLKFEAKDLTDYFNKEIDKHFNQFYKIAESEQARHLSRKKTIPPAPPSAGNTPRQPKVRGRSWNETGNDALSKFKKLLG